MATKRKRRSKRTSVKFAIDIEGKPGVGWWEGHDLHLKQKRGKHIILKNARVTDIDFDFPEALSKTITISPKIEFELVSGN